MKLLPFLPQTSQPITESQIQERLSQHQPVRVPRGSRVLLVQSGAFLPDSTLIAAVNRHYSSVPFSGQPARTNNPSNALAADLAP